MALIRSPLATPAAASRWSGQWWRSGSRVWRLVVTAGVIIVACLSMATMDYSSLHSLVFLMDLVGVVAATLALRFPWAWFAVGLAFVVVGLSPETASIATFIMVFPALLDLNSRRPAWRGILFLALVAAGLSYAWDDRPTLGSILFDVVFVGVAAMGATIRSNEESSELRVALSEERRRNERVAWARDMHDTVASSMSHVTLTANTLLLTHNTAMSREVRAGLETITHESTAGLNELRAILLLLRDATPEPRPGAFQDPVAKEWQRSSRLLASQGFVVECSPRELHRDVSTPAVEEALAYAIRELATNFSRHALPGSRVAMRFDATPRRVRVMTVNMVGDPELRQLPHSGYGLLGLRERMALVGGTVTAGPEGDGEWRACVEVPLVMGPVTPQEA